MAERRPTQLALLLVLCVLLAACGESIEPTETTVTAAASPAESTSAEAISASRMGDLEGWGTTTISIDDHDLTVALADSAEERSHGLRGVEDLGDLDGMLFVFEQPRESTFVMEDTLIPLTIGFFDPGGRLVESYEMVPCLPDEECDVYPSTAAVSHALEVPAGSLTFSPDTRLLVP